MLPTFGDGMVESLWVKTRKQTNNADVIVGVYCGLPSQDEDTNKLFFKEQREISKSTALVLIGDFNLLDVDWEDHAAGTNRSRRLLKHLDDNFMVQVVGKLTKKDVLDLLHGSREGLTGELVAILARAITKQSGLKTLLTGGKVLAKLHPFTKSASLHKKKVLAKLHMKRPEFRQLRELVSKVPGKMHGSSSAGHTIRTIS